MASSPRRLSPSMGAPARRRRALPAAQHAARRSTTAPRARATLRSRTTRPPRPAALADPPGRPRPECATRASRNGAIGRAPQADFQPMRPRSLGAARIRAMNWNPAGPSQRWARWRALLIAIALACSEAHAATAAPPPDGAASGTSATVACPPPPQAPTADQLQAAQREARDRGFLWRISKQGRSSYLYGTLHVGKLPWVFAGPRLREAIANTDTLALELDVTDPELTRNPPPAATAPLALPEAM